MTKQNYITSRRTATTVFLARELGKPLLIEGPAGVGKTGLAGALASALGTELVRLQCYPGLDESKILYQWNYQKQLLHIQMYGNEIDIFSRDYLLERPLLRAFQARRPVVFLVDEIDKSEEEFDSFLLEALSEFQVSIPELGTVRARQRPYVIITSNCTRELSDALKRRCLYLYLNYPAAPLEVAIIRLKVPGLPEHLTQAVVSLVQKIRTWQLKKAPSITESIDWARTLTALGVEMIDEQLVQDTLNVLLKYESDIKKVAPRVADLVSISTPEKVNPAPEQEQPPQQGPDDSCDPLAKFNF